MKFKSLVFIAICLSFFQNVFAFAEADSTSQDKKIDVKLSTSITSDKELKAQRTIDGEKPVQPLNLIIGPSKLTLWGYAQTGYTLKNDAGTKTNALDITRIILMARGELTDQLSFLLCMTPLKANYTSITRNTLFRLQSNCVLVNINNLLH